MTKTMQNLENLWLFMYRNGPNKLCRFLEKTTCIIKKYLTYLFYFITIVTVKLLQGYNITGYYIMRYTKLLGVFVLHFIFTGCDATNLAPPPQI